MSNKELTRDQGYLMECLEGWAERSPEFFHGMVHGAFLICDDPDFSAWINYLAKAHTEIESRGN